MLVLKVRTEELYNEATSEFVSGSEVRLELEHSLVSASKWESFWGKPFLSSIAKTTEETLSYVQMMVQDVEISPEILQEVLQQHLKEIREYIDAPMTATTIAENPNAPRSREVITTEVIYWWMISMQIPMECQHWHLNRLMTLIRVIAAKNAPKTKMTAADRRQLNKQRQAKYKTKG